MNWYIRYKLSSKNIDFSESLLNILNFKKPELLDWIKSRHPEWEIPNDFDLVKYRDGGWALIDRQNRNEIVREEDDISSVINPARLEQLFYITT